MSQFKINKKVNFKTKTVDGIINKWKFINDDLNKIDDTGNII